MDIRHRAAVGLVCVALALAGCARSPSGSGSHPEGGPSATTPAAAPPAESSPSAASPPAATPPATSPSASLAELVLTGQVQSGVEAGCLILTDAGRAYELIGGDPAIVKAGARVRVVGHLAVGIMSHCMQGQPFSVDEAHAL
jgi:hypothetical protein